MEHHTSPIGTTAPRVSRVRSLARAAAGLAALVLLAGVAGCGGSAADPTATLESLSGDTDFGVVTASTTIGTTGPVIFAVKDSDGNPIAGADIDLYTGASSGVAVMFYDFSWTSPAGGIAEVHTKTSDVGTFTVFPAAALAACPAGATADVDGSFQVVATISGSEAVWIGSFALDCG